MVRIKATKTERYAQQPVHLPHLALVKGQEYELNEVIAARVVELNGGEYVTDDIKTPEDKQEQLDGGPSWLAGQSTENKTE